VRGGGRELGEKIGSLTGWPASLTGLGWVNREGLEEYIEWECAELHTKCSMHIILYTKYKSTCTLSMSSKFKEFGLAFLQISDPILILFSECGNSHLVSVNKTTR